MPASRARTAICSAPLEWPSSPGLPTRNLSRRPSASLTRSTSSRSSDTSSLDTAAALADAGGGAVLAERVAQRLGPLAGGHAGAGGGDRRRHDVLRVVGGRRARARPAPRRRPPGRARRASARAAARCLASTSGIDDQDPAVGAGGERRGLGRGEAVHADHDLLAGLDPLPALALGLDQRGLHVVDGLDGAAELGHRGASPPGRPRAAPSTSPSITLEPSKMSGYSSRSVS